ncbi:cuticle protein 14 isoform a [Trichonephila clavata]|uniref:Cuticle protein 14 isoform a n=1 Tax=Trichonephila clavata TaxID=2740835 RepID=A0A8X6F0D0_TRICU|nr:cuticle protein 14 isoform a [Trichonephila clavata]
MIQKVVVFLSLMAISRAVPLLIPEVGASTQYKTEDNHGNYAFGYSEDHTSGGSFRKEAGDTLGNKVGSYGLHDADGRARVVNYVADSAGFRADVHTNEPGVDPTQDSADVTVNKALVVAPAPAVIKSVVAPAPSVVAPIPAVIAPASTIVTHSHLHPAMTVLHSPLYHAHAPLLVHGAHVFL